MRFSNCRAKYDYVIVFQIFMMYFDGVKSPTVKILTRLNALHIIPLPRAEERSILHHLRLNPIYPNIPSP